MAENLKTRDHVVLHVDDLRDWLGMTGTVLNVWMEDDAEYVHMTTIPEDGDPNAMLVCRGGYCESRARGQQRHKEPAHA